MTLRDKIGEWLADYAVEDILLADGLDEAFIGMTDKHVAIYDIRKCILTLMLKHEWSEEEAQEWMDFNVLNAYVGDKTPVYVYTFDEGE